MLNLERVEEIKKNLLEGEETPVVLLIMGDDMETDGKYLKLMIPFIQAGFTNVVIDHYQHTAICNEEIPKPTAKEIHRLYSTSGPGGIVEVGGQPVAVYRIYGELED